MNQREWQKAYEPLPATLEARVRHTLGRLSNEKEQRARVPLKTAALVLALLLALAGIAYAVFFSPVARHFGWLYGEDVEQELL